MPAGRNVTTVTFTGVRLMLSRALTPQHCPPGKQWISGQLCITSHRNRRRRLRAPPVLSVIREQINGTLNPHRITETPTLRLTTVGETWRVTSRCVWGCCLVGFRLARQWERILEQEIKFSENTSNHLQMKCYFICKYLLENEMLLWVRPVGDWDMCHMQ